MSFGRDTRGLAGGLMLFMAAVIIVSLLYMMINPVVQDSQSMLTNQSDSQNATDAINERATIWTNIPIFGLFAAGVFLVGRGIFEARLR